MPEAIALAIVPVLTSAGVATAIGVTATYYLALGISYALLAGASYLLASLLVEKPKVPKPEDGKYNLKQSVPPLTYVLGRVKKGGDYVFLEERGGYAYHIIVHAAHAIQGYVEHYLHDERVALDGTGYVVDPPHFGSAVRLEWKLGPDASTVYGEVAETFPEIWGDDHRGDGLSTIMMAVASVSSAHIQSVFPQGMPSLTSTMDGMKLYDPRTETVYFSTNLALMRLWHLTHPVGGKMSLDDMYIPDWINAANVCDQSVLTRSGDYIQRYHGGFWFRADNNPVDIGRTIDQAGELVLYERPDGKIGVHAGEYTVPNWELTGDDIIRFGYNANQHRKSQVLAVRGRFTDPTKFFNTADASIYGDPYVDDTERTKTVDNVAVQHNNHMNRLQKLAYIRAHAPKVHIVAHYEAAKEVPYRRFIPVHYPPMVSHGVIELVSRPTLSLSSMTCEFDGMVIPANLYDFVASAEEGAPGEAIEIIEREDVPAPENFDVTIESETLSGGTGFYALATWDHVNDTFVYELEWQPTAGGAVQTANSIAGFDEVRSTHLADDVEYRFRLRAWSVGVASDYTDYIIATP